MDFRDEDDSFEIDYFHDHDHNQGGENQADFLELVNNIEFQPRRYDKTFVVNWLFIKESNSRARILRSHRARILMRYLSAWFVIKGFRIH